MRGWTDPLVAFYDNKFWYATKKTGEQNNPLRSDDLWERFLKDP